MVAFPLGLLSGSPAVEEAVFLWTVLTLSSLDIAHVVRRIMLWDRAGVLSFSVIIKALMWFLSSKFSTVAFTRFSMLETVYVCSALTLLAMFSLINPDKHWCKSMSQASCTVLISSTSFYLQLHEGKLPYFQMAQTNFFFFFCLIKGEAWFTCQCWNIYSFIQVFSFYILHYSTHSQVTECDVLNYTFQMLLLSWHWSL